MTTLRRSIPFVEKSFKLLGSRSIHITSPLKAVKAARKSPRVVKAAPSVKIAPAYISRRKELPNPEKCQPPPHMIKSAISSGALDLTGSDHTSETIRVFLGEFAKHGLFDENQALQVISDHKLAPAHLTILSAILRRCPEVGQRKMGRSLAVAASALGDKTATFELIQSALNSDSLVQADMHEPARRLVVLAKSGDHEAMGLLSKVLFSQGKLNEAESWLRKATEPPTGTLDFAGSGEALTYLGRILQQKGDVKGAEASFKKAALKLDEPPAYFHLSKFAKAGSQEQQVYLLKAASSGVIEACHNLGMLELRKLSNSEEKSASLEGYGMALEWLRVSASDGFAPSQVAMAVLCKTHGEEKNASAWLDKAEESAKPDNDKTAHIKRMVAKVKGEWSKGKYGNLEEIEASSDLK